MTARSHTFTHAITRLPGRSIVAGLRAVDTGTPDLETFLGHHADYVDALRSTGAEVVVLDALEDYPDSVFVEDAALCLQEGAIVMRPGAPSRLGEAALMRPTLEMYYGEVLEIPAPATIEGGDVLVCESEILVGTSARTNAQGIAELGRLVGGGATRCAPLKRLKVCCTSRPTVLCWTRRPYCRRDGWRPRAALTATG
jgi:dimethylargininase